MCPVKIPIDTLRKWDHFQEWGSFMKRTSASLACLPKEVGPSTGHFDLKHLNLLGPSTGINLQAIIEKCRMISDGAKQYKVGFSFLLPTDEKLRDGYFGYPLKASAKSDQWKQLVELASKLPMHFSRDVKPGKIQFVGANYKTKIVDVLDKTTVEKFTKKASTSKFLKMYAKHAQMNADFMSDKKKIYSAFTLDNVCKISEDLVSDKTYEFLIGTRYPVLDVVPAKRFIKGEGFGIHQ